MAIATIVLTILDGYGHRVDAADNAVRLAKTPNLDALFAHNPHTLLFTSGADVGLPPGQMGNSEVGHLNLGTGRVAMMELSRIDHAVYDGALARNETILGAIAYAQNHGGKLHLLGLLSDGGVHSSIEHLLALVDAATEQHIQVVVHAFLDGRDVAPGSAPSFLSRLESRLAGKGIIGSVFGRFYAMDRDNRWERVALAYNAIAHGQGPRSPTAAGAYANSQALGASDEFVLPTVIGAYRGMAAEDSAIHFNFRPDRARELTAALALPEFTGFARESDRRFAHYVCMTQYDGSFGLPIAFRKDEYPGTLGEVLANANLKQFRCAETEKYAHITYFFNGSREAPFPGEERKLVASPKDVATYDLKPQMSAAEVAQAVVAAIESKQFQFVLINFANPDMVGHTGVLSAAIAAVEAVDAAMGRVAAACAASGAGLLITADHGNCELMRDPTTGAPHTAHTTFPVPFLMAVPGGEQAQLRAAGRLADVAPTVLELLGLAQPAMMTGKSLIASMPSSA